MRMELLSYELYKYQGLLTLNLQRKQKKPSNQVFLPLRMQAAPVCFTGAMPLKGTKNLVPRRSTKPYRTVFFPKAVTAASPDTNTVDYSSSESVFPAEACETIGGIACDAQMFPEVKLESQNRNTRARSSSEEVDRDYLEYNEPKTVFPAEACDDLGGEFCDPEYQKGVY